MAGIVVAILVFFVFLVHLFVPSSIAPSNGTSRMMDIVFVICAIGLGLLSWMTYKEQD